MRHYFTYDNKSSADFGLFISGLDTWDAAEKDIENIEVPGRNGDLHIDKHRFKNQTIEYKKCFMRKDWETEFPKMCAFYSSRANKYYRLTDTYHVGQFRLARYKSGLDNPKVGKNNQFGEINMKFDCDPRRFLLAGETYNTIATDTSMINPTAFPSKPLIEVTGFGTFTINGKGITVSSHNYPVTMIDLETMTAYYQDENLNSNVSRLDQIQLNPGANPIVLGSGITLRIQGRWWTI